MIRRRHGGGVAKEARIEIRQAVDGDAAGLARLFGQLGNPAETGVMGERLGLVAARADHWCGVAMSEDGSLIGCLHVFLAPILEAGMVAHVGGLIVETDWRRRGVGCRLMAAGEAWARDAGAGAMYVRTRVTRPDAHAFYESIGYVRAKTQFAYRKRLDACAPPEAGRSHLPEDPAR